MVGAQDRGAYRPGAVGGQPRDPAQLHQDLGYRLVGADCQAERNRSRPQVGKIAGDEVLRARVLAEMSRSRTPRQIAGRLLLEATDTTVGTVSHSPAAGGATARHEASYRFIYAPPTGELAKHEVMLRSKRTTRRRHKPVGERTAPIVGMVSRR